MLIRRLLQFNVAIHRQQGMRLGLEVAQERRHLRILAIGEGPFQTWNAGVAFDLQVQSTDCIVEANGVRGTSAQLLEQMQGGGPLLDLVLVRSQVPRPVKTGPRPADSEAVQAPVGGRAVAAADESASASGTGAAPAGEVTQDESSSSASAAAPVETVRCATVSYTSAASGGENTQS